MVGTRKFVVRAPGLGAVATRGREAETMGKGERERSLVMGEPGGEKCQWIERGVEALAV